MHRSVRLRVWTFEDRGEAVYIMIMNDSPAQLPAKTPLLLDLGRGLAGRCPRCGEGRMFDSFLKVTDRCAVCGEELYHHRADDLPAYVVILLAGHIVVPLACALGLAYAMPLWMVAAIWLPATAALVLGLLQPVKGVIVALQWRLGMHGFAAARKLSSPSSRGERE